MNNSPQPGTLYAGDYIRAFSGVYVNVFDPKPEMFLIEDIAEGLAFNYRWGGHTKSKITVAEHSGRVSDLLPNELKLCGLMHDASEAYLGDMASPIKKGMPEYYRVENLVMTCIANKFGFAWPMPQLVHKSDIDNLNQEFDDCVMTKNRKSLTPRQAKKAFLKIFKALTQTVAA